MTVLEFPFAEPVAVPAVYCVGDQRRGLASVLSGNFQRLAASPDGSGVVFEVTNDHAVSAIAAVPEQEGIFYVRSDGRGLRRLGPASRDPSYVTVSEPRGPSGVFFLTKRIARCPSTRVRRVGSVVAPALDELGGDGLCLSGVQMAAWSSGTSAARASASRR